MERITGPVKSAGRLHAPTGTWTRGQSHAASFGPSQVLYSHTAASGYYHAIVGPLGANVGLSIIDDGVIPSTGDPAPFPVGPGRDSSTVTSVTIGYCDFDPTPGSAGFLLEFYEHHAPCAGTPDPAHLAGTVDLVGGPSNGCWVVQIDGLSFSMAHDGEGVHDADFLEDSFGVRWSYTGTGTQQAGLQIAGDPQLTDASWMPGGSSAPPGQDGSNTYYGSVSGCPGVGSGYGNQDFFWLTPGGIFQGCWFFGGYLNTGAGCGGPLNFPFGGHFIEIAGEAPDPGAPISAPGCAGSVNAAGLQGGCAVFGDLSAASNDARLVATDLPLNQFGIFASGLAATAPGAINSGNGTVCIDPTASGGIGRFDGMGQVKSSGALGTFSLDTGAGEWDLALLPTGVGTYAAMAGTRSYFQAWFREPVGAGWNFTGSCSVLWQ